MALSLAGILSACGTFAGGPESPSGCPRAQILEGADLDAAYRVAGVREPSALRYVAAIKGLESSCRYDDEGVEVDLAFDIVAERGPALDADAVRLTYFVATVGPQGDIRSKQVLGTTVEFAEGGDVAGLAEQLTLRLPHATRADAPAYRIYVAFQTERPGTAPRPRLLP